MAVSFGGDTTRKPSILTNVDTTGLVRGGVTGSGVVGIIGTADSGSESIIEFRLPSAAKTEYEGGPLLDVGNAAWSHGSQVIKMLRVGNGIAPSTISLIASGGVGEAIELNSIKSGDKFNDIQVKVEVGDSEPYRKVTIQLYDSATNRFTTETFEENSTANIVSAINTPASAGGTPSQLVTATAGTSASLLLDTMTFTNMSSGSNGTVNSSVIENALALFEKEDVNILIFDDEIVDSTSHALLNAHCQVMSNMDKERICILGHELGLYADKSNSIGDKNDPTSIVGMAYGLNSDRAVFVSPGTDGRSAAYTAAKVAGLLCKIDVAEPLTFKSISSTTIETQYTRTELESLIQYGICAIENARSGRRVCRGITTIQDPSSVTEDAFKEVSVKRIVDTCVDTVRSNLEAIYIGKKGVNGTEAAIKSTIQSLLTRLKENQTITGFGSINVVRDTLRPDAFRVEFQVAPTFPINFIMVDFKLQNVIV